MRDTTQDAELILPCMDQNEQPIHKITVSYVFHCYDEDGCNGESLSLANGAGCENYDTSGTQLQTVEGATFRTTEDVNDRPHGKIIIIRQREVCVWRYVMFSQSFHSFLCNKPQ